MPFATINGERVASCVLHVPAVGPWWADVDLELAPSVSGRVTLALGELQLSGTVRAREAGTRGEQRMLRLVAGADGWGSLVSARAYHSDAGVRARNVVDDVALEVGEEIASFAVAAERIGRDYVREGGRASRVLEDVIGGAPWWVGYDGRTRVGARPASSPSPTAYHVLDYLPRDRIVLLAVDDLRAVEVGALLSAGLDEQQTVRSLAIHVEPDSVRVRAWVGGTDDSRGLAGLLRGIIERATDGHVRGPRRYRVIRMSGDRVELQIVRRATGFPDIQPVSMWPGIAGAHAELAMGAEVLVDWIDGDRTQPIVTHFAGKDGNGWTPTQLTLDASTLIKLGKDATALAARADLVDQRVATLQQAHDTHTHLYTPGTAPTPVASAVPAAPIGSLASVAADKVQVQ